MTRVSTTLSPLRPLPRKSSAASASPNSPLKLVTNDDAAEKRERRKRFLQEKNSNILASPRQSVNVVDKDAVKAKLPSLLTLPDEEINSRYEEWMKIAADNVWA